MVDCRGVGTVDAKLPKAGANLSGGLEVLPEVESDFMFGFPKLDAG